MTNIAINVVVPRSLNRRINRVSNNLKFTVEVLRAAVRSLIREVLKTTPFVTGRLYRSFRISNNEGYLLLEFRAPYAYRVEKTSRRNMNYLRRGLRRGLARANATRFSTPDGTLVGYHFRSRGIRRRDNGGIMVAISYRRI